MINLGWGSKESKKFITNVGLITSNGVYGQNIMACEWTHHISYNPGLIAVCIHAKDATAINIKKSKEFGVNLCSTEQNIISGISGRSRGKYIDKIKVLKELGYKFYKARKINVLMVRGAVLNLECKLFKEITLGDHIMFVGNVVHKSCSNKEPLAYHKGRYWILNKTIKKPGKRYIQRINKLTEKYKKLD